MYDAAAAIRWMMRRGAHINTTLPLPPERAGSLFAHLLPVAVDEDGPFFKVELGGGGAAPRVLELGREVEAQALGVALVVRGIREDLWIMQ